LLEEFFSSVSFKPRVAMTSNSNETIKQAVMAGMGIAGISQHTIGIELGLGLLKALPVQGLPLMRTWFVAHRRRMPMMPLHESLRRFIIAEGREIIEALENFQMNAPATQRAFGRVAGRERSVRAPNSKGSRPRS
jgi:DNA-binding transcriptional LysR family regulator